MAIGSAARTFRKLYQFVAQPVLAVRSKIGAIAAAGAKGGIAAAGKKWVLEAQLENVGGEGIVVERCLLKGGAGVVWKGGVGSLDGEARGGSGGKSVVLRPRDVYQVMFVIEDREVGGVVAAGGGAPKALAQVDIDWRSAMGEKGRLTTGWLAARG